MEDQKIVKYQDKYNVITENDCTNSKKIYY
jgi:hypothetical protein